MRTRAKTISTVLCAAAVTGLFAVPASAIEIDATTKTLPGHGETMIHRTEARMEKLATRLQHHAAQAADKTEAAAGRVAAHLENAGHQLARLARKAADHFETKLDHLTE